MRKPIRLSLAALLAFGAQLPVAALAQDKAPPAPTDAAVPGAPVAYESAFAGYRSDKDNKAVDWKESNARVAQPHDEHAGHDMSAMKHVQPPPAPESKKKDPHHGHQHKE